MTTPQMMPARTDVGQLLETMDDKIEAFAALGALLECALDAGAPMGHISNGVERIFHQQVEELRAVRGELRQHFDEMRRSKLKVANIHEIAKLAGVPVELAAIVVFVATGIPFREKGQLMRGGSDA